MYMACGLTLCITTISPNSLVLFRINERGSKVTRRVRLLLNASSYPLASALNYRSEIWQRSRCSACRWDRICMTGKQTTLSAMYAVTVIKRLIKGALRRFLRLARRLKYQALLDEHNGLAMRQSDTSHCYWPAWGPSLSRPTSG